MRKSLCSRWAHALCLILAVSGTCDGSEGEAYRLVPNDVVRINVFQEEDLTTTARISKDGTINFPLVGSAKIGGQTVEEAVSTMNALLHEYLVKPQVSLTIVDYSKRRFTILGQVNKPGTFEMPDEVSLNLLEAIGMAGGYTKIARPSRITLKRQVGGKETTLKLDAKEMMTDEGAQRFEVRPGDTIFVGETIF